MCSTSRDVALAFCDGRPLQEYTDDTPRVVAMIQAADALRHRHAHLPGRLHRIVKNLPRPCARRALMSKVAGLIATGPATTLPDIDYVLRPVLMWFTCTFVPGSGLLRSQQIQDQEVDRYARRDDLEQLGRGRRVMHQRLQGSPMGPLPLSLMGRRRT